MPAPDERIREVVQSYVDRVAHGTADEVLALYADDATVEDPVGSEVLVGKEAIRGFYATLEPLEQEAVLGDVRIAAGQAAFGFELRTRTADATYVVSPIDVMTFDDDGRITSMRAFWGPADMTVA